uniref:Uncharacterized protein n=1 Tax=Arundo donax TaxID=35708 RepID=A0A0A9HLX8_ARUDO
MSKQDPTYLSSSLIYFLMLNYLCNCIFCFG